MHVQKFPRNVSEVKGVLAGIVFNLLCAVVFFLCAAWFTQINPISTAVLSVAPLIQGVLIAIPAAAAFRLAHTRRWFAIGLVLGIVGQVVLFVVWHEHWIQQYAG